MNQRIFLSILACLLIHFFTNSILAQADASRVRLDVLFGLEGNAYFAQDSSMDLQSDILPYLGKSVALRTTLRLGEHIGLAVSPELRMYRKKLDLEYDRYVEWTPWEPAHTDHYTMKGQITAALIVVPILFEYNFRSATNGLYLHCGPAFELVSVTTVYDKTVNGYPSVTDYKDNFKLLGFGPQINVGYSFPIQEVARMRLELYNQIHMPVQAPAAVQVLSVGLRVGIGI